MFVGFDSQMNTRFIPVIWCFFFDRAKPCKMISEGCYLNYPQ